MTRKRPAESNIACAVTAWRSFARRAVGHIVYLCGFAGGEDEYRDLFDLMIVIVVDNDTLSHRLATRTTNNYGKAAHEREGILKANVGWAESYRSRGAVIVDGTRPIAEVAAEIISAAETWRTFST